MGEHFDADQLPGRTADVLPEDGFMDGFHLVQVQFPGEDDDIGPLGIKAQGFDV